MVPSGQEGSGHAAPLARLGGVAAGAARESRCARGASGARGRGVGPMAGGAAAMWLGGAVRGAARVPERGLGSGLSASLPTSTRRERPGLLQGE